MVEGQRPLPRLRVRDGLLLALLSATMLALGVLVYMIDRAPGSAPGLPAWLALRSPGSAQAAVFGVFSGSLPSFVHAFAFSALSCLLLPPRRPLFAAACVFWGLVDGVFECLQWPAAARAVAAALRHVDGHGLPLDAVAAYFVNGRFDPLDLLASTLGAAAALLLAHTVMDRSAGLARPRAPTPNSLREPAP